MIISVDFDGTCVTHMYPETGKDIGAEIVLKKLYDKGNKIILLSMRDHGVYSYDGTDVLDNALRWFEKYNIDLYGINENPTQKEWSTSRKVYANIYIDDQFLGCPLYYNKDISDRPFVYWKKILNYFTIMQLFTEDEEIDIIKELKEKYPTLY